MTLVKVIVTTEDELAEMIAKQVEKCFAANQQNITDVKRVTKEGNLTSKDVQQLFSISSTTIWQWEKKGILKPVIVQRRKTYLREDIDSLLQTKQLKQRV